MIRLALYGKGGIGKSTTIASMSAALAHEGKRVLQIGCDPKADSTILLRGGRRLPTVLDMIRAKQPFGLDDVVQTGYAGTLCAEAGGPTPGMGCAGRGIITALMKLEELGAYETLAPDVVFYDVPGDVVCGGFTMPLRQGYADSVFILVSGENMAIHAAANIALAVEGFRERGYAALGGFVLNRRNVPREEEKVRELADDFHTGIMYSIPYSAMVQQAEARRMTVVEAFADSEEARVYRDLAHVLVGRAEELRAGGPA